MPTRSSKLDLNQLAKAIVDEATGETPKTEQPPVKNEAAVALGRLGGKKGGAARAAKLSPEERSAIAKAAANKRWSMQQVEDQAPSVEAQKQKKKVAP